MGQSVTNGAIGSAEATTPRAVERAAAHYSTSRALATKTSTANLRPAELASKPRRLGASFYLFAYLDALFLRLGSRAG